MKEKKVEEKRDKLPDELPIEIIIQKWEEEIRNFDIFIFYLSMSPITISRN